MRVDPITVNKPQTFEPVLSDWFHKSLSGVFQKPTRSRLTYRIHVRVNHIEDTWLIVVRSKRCRLDGHVISPAEPECDLRYEMDCHE